MIYLKSKDRGSSILENLIAKRKIPIENEIPSPSFGRKFYCIKFISLTLRNSIKIFMFLDFTTIYHYKNVLNLFLKLLIGSTPLCFFNLIECFEMHIYVCNSNCTTTCTSPLWNVLNLCKYFHKYLMFTYFYPHGMYRVNGFEIFYPNKLSTLWMVCMFVIDLNYPTKFIILQSLHILHLI